MKVSLTWLKDYVNVALPAEKLAHRLTMAGMEVEKIHDVDGQKVLELEITPNRPDCLNMFGLARETAAVLNKPLKLPTVRKRRLPTETCDITVKDPAGCPRYIGQLIKGVKITASPEAQARRLQAVGVRTINNIVDITNFCLLETGQPMHAFDYDKLAGGKILVRRAAAGEKIVTIDGVERDLDPSILVIADARRPVAIAGIMGGRDTEVTESTRQVLLESAYFDPILIRRAARKLGLSSDSSYRFERGVDMEMVATGAHRAVALMRDQAAGVLTAYRDVYPSTEKRSPKPVTIRIDEINRLLGGQVSPGQCKKILKSLGFSVTVPSRGVLSAVPPSFRGDIKSGVDMIEEIARVIGYDNLPVSLPAVKMSGIPPSPRRMMRRRVRDVLKGQGFQEVVSYALMNAKALEGMGCSQEIVRVQNPLSQDQEVMRPTGIPGLLQAARLNLNRGQKDLRFFEIGKRYHPRGEDEILTLLMSGQRLADWRESAKTAVSIFDFKGVVTRLFAPAIWEQVSADSYAGEPYETGCALELKWRARPLGHLGLLSESLRKQWDLRCDEIYIAQIEMESFYDIIPPSRDYQPISPYPAVVRDVSLAVKQDVSFQTVKDTAREVGGALLVAVDFREEYLGEKIPAGHRGLVFSLVYQSPERTLTETDVQDLHAKISQAFVYRLQAVIR